MENVQSILLFGSNLGDRHEYLRRAIDMVAHLDYMTLLNISGIYETEPVEVKEQPSFLNIAASVSTSLKPVKLLASLKEIEKVVGRLQRERWHEREIDIDIIFYGDQIIETETLIIPHPKGHLRRFVLQPLNEIASEYVHPVFHKTVSQLLAECKDMSSVIRASEPWLITA